MVLRGSGGLVRGSVHDLALLVPVACGLPAFFPAVVRVGEIVGEKWPEVVRARTPPWAEKFGDCPHVVVSPHPAKSPDFSWSQKADDLRRSGACGSVPPNASRLPVVSCHHCPWHLSPVPILMAIEVLSSLISGSRCGSPGSGTWSPRSVALGLFWPLVAGLELIFL